VNDLSAIGWAACISDALLMYPNASWSCRTCLLL